jgi:hypothetical protein
VQVANDIASLLPSSTAIFRNPLDGFHVTLMHTSNHNDPRPDTRTAEAGAAVQSLPAKERPQVCVHAPNPPELPSLTAGVSLNSPSLRPQASPSTQQKPTPGLQRDVGMGGRDSDPPRRVNAPANPGGEAAGPMHL